MIRCFNIKRLQPRLEGEQKKINSQSSIYKKHAEKMKNYVTVECTHRKKFC